MGKARETAIAFAAEIAVAAAGSLGIASAVIALAVDSAGLARQDPAAFAFTVAGSFFFGLAAGLLTRLPKRFRERREAMEAEGRRLREEREAEEQRIREELEAEERRIRAERDAWLFDLESMTFEEKALIKQVRDRGEVVVSGMTRTGAILRLPTAVCYVSVHEIAADACRIVLSEEGERAVRFWREALDRLDAKGFSFGGR